MILLVLLVELDFLLFNVFFWIATVISSLSVDESMIIKRNFGTCADD